MRRQEMCRHNASSGGNASSGNASSQCVVRGQCVVRECVFTMRREGVMRRQGAMRRQGMCRHDASSGVNVSSGGNASSGNVSSQCVVRGAGDITNVLSQCVVSVSAKCHTQAAGALQVLLMSLWTCIGFASTSLALSSVNVSFGAAVHQQSPCGMRRVQNSRENELTYSTSCQKKY